MLMEPELNQPVCVCLCMYVCVSHLTVEQPVKSMNEFTGSIFHFFIWSPHSGHVVFCEQSETMNYFRWQSEAGRVWIGRKSAESVTARHPSTMGVLYEERGERKRGEREKRGERRVETEMRIKEQKRQRSEKER